VIERQNGPEIVPRLIMPLVLTIDHRVLDGADAVRFLQVVKEVLEDPDELLMSMV
jgi:pyruvate dehydrogenase E2 component (dihydrolipoamide acetyltransferase)